MISIITFLLFSAPANAQVQTVDQIGAQHSMLINIAKVAKSRCLKVLDRYQDGSPSDVEFNIYVTNGVSSCSPPTFEKYCILNYKISTHKLQELDYHNNFYCRVKNNSFEYGEHTIEFEQVYCPTITCKVNAAESLLFDFAQPYTLGNFRHNMGKYLEAIEER